MTGSEMYVDLPAGTKLYPLADDDSVRWSAPMTDVDGSEQVPVIDRLLSPYYAPGQYLIVSAHLHRYHVVKHAGEEYAVEAARCASTLDLEG